MSEQPESDERSGLEAPGGEGDGVGDALRAAVERTLAATADSAEGTRQRAQDLLDDVVRRGQVAREQVTKRGEEATTRLAEAISELRRADAEGIEELGSRLAAVERRLAALEVASGPIANPQLEAEDSLRDPHHQRDSGD
jgi:polyhydroxyalkanoate synthesis regulator phasin